VLAVYKLTSNTDVADVEQQVQDYIRQEVRLAFTGKGALQSCRLDVSSPSVQQQQQQQQLLLTAGRS
jgi:hypothetical protein